MPEQVLTDVGIWIDGLAYAFVSNSVSFEGSADAPEKTTFKGEWRRRAAGGLKTASFSLDGYVDTAGPDAARFAALADGQSVMVVPTGETPGELAYIIPVTVSAHTPLAGAVGDLATFSYAGEGDGAPARAQVLDIQEGVTADVAAGRVELGAVTAAQTLRVWVHVARGGGSVELDLRSSNSETVGTGTSRATRAGINATGLYELSFTGTTTNTWWFLDYDVSGGAADFDFASAAAIS